MRLLHKLVCWALPRVPEEYKNVKIQHCPWRDKFECRFAIILSETNFHSKKNCTEIEVHYGKQMEVISNLAWEYGHVTTAPVNLFIEIH